MWHIWTCMHELTTLYSPYCCLTGLSSRRPNRRLSQGPSVVLPRRLLPGPGLVWRQRWRIRNRRMTKMKRKRRNRNQRLNRLLRRKLGKHVARATVLSPFSIHRVAGIEWLLWVAVAGSLLLAHLPPASESTGIKSMRRCAVWSKKLWVLLSGLVISLWWQTIFTLLTDIQKMQAMPGQMEEWNFREGQVTGTSHILRAKGCCQVHCVSPLQALDLAIETISLMKMQSLLMT